MAAKLQIDIHHLPRIEGHGNIHVLIENGSLKKASWEIVETPRFFEVMLKGRHYTGAAVLVARICGICSISHCLASLGATEDAFGVTIPAAARKLRLLAKHGETLQSHYLHLFFLAAPDFLGAPSVLQLIESNPEVVNLGLRLKGTANRLCDLVAGRSTHPISLQVGGVTRMPESKKLASSRDDLAASLNDLEKAVELFLLLEIPDFARETEFVSLKAEGSYPFIGGRIISSDGVDMDKSEYRSITNEYVTDNNTSKWCRLSRESYAVGALARFNNNRSMLDPRAREAAELLGLSRASHNPFLNNLAQLVECIHVTHECVRMLDELLPLPSETPTMAEVTPRASAGTGALEAPRGLLFHHYEYDEKGRIRLADCVIPTTQNNANIQSDLEKLVECQAARGVSDSELERLCSMLVRAYDPCISCSVH